MLPLYSTLRASGPGVSRPAPTRSARETGQAREALPLASLAAAGPLLRVFRPDFRAAGVLASASSASGC